MLYLFIFSGRARERFGRTAAAGKGKGGGGIQTEHGYWLSDFSRGPISARALEPPPRSGTAEGASQPIGGRAVEPSFA